jgi:hypothetical protein
MTDINLGLLEHGPHANRIREMATLCFADERIQAVWVGGSLAAGTGDMYSDIDFRIAVEPGHVDDWSSPEWQRYLPIPVCGGLLLRFGAQTLLHHLVLTDGSIIDFYVQDTTGENFEPKLVVLACRDGEFRAKLEGFMRPADSLAREIDGATARQFFVDYWITTHKQLKALARKYDYTPFAGLYIERMALLRAWYMQAVGKDLDARPTIHMLGALHRGLEGELTEQQRNILGLPSRTPQETATVIESVRAEMASVGRALAVRHAFAYPHELEEVVLQFWNEHKESAGGR